MSICYLSKFYFWGSDLVYTVTEACYTLAVCVFSNSIARIRIALHALRPNIMLWLTLSSVTLPSTSLSDT